MTGPRSYLLCGTPRSGTTLLCDLLKSTGVAGRPESYFREPDRGLWSGRFGIRVAPDGSVSQQDFVRATLEAGTTPNGLFAARIMWGTVDPLVERLGREGTDLEILENVLGVSRFVFVRRNDVIAQAVSWARAEQTGYWQPGDEVANTPIFDFNQVSLLVDTIEDHNAAWLRWFDDHDVRPQLVTYEALVDDPRQTVLDILGFLNVDPPLDWRAEPTHDKQADEFNAEWIVQYLRQRPAR